MWSLWAVPFCPCLAQRALAVHLTHLTILLSVRVPRPPSICDFPRVDCCLNLNGDRPSLAHSAFSHPTTGLTGWLVSGTQNRDSVPWLPAQHLSQPGTHRHRMYLSNDYVICCWPLRWTSLFSHHLVGSPMQIPESWLAWPGPEKAQDPHVQLPQDSLPAAHSIQVPQGSVPLALPSTTGSLPKNRLQDASSLRPTARPHQRAGDTEKPQAGLGLQDCPVQQGERQVLWGSVGTGVKRTQQPRHVLAGSSGTHGWFPAHCARRCG